MLILLLTFIALPTLASFDLSTGVSARSYPGFGGEAFVDSGYNSVLWGKGDKKNPLYGLIRPAVTVASSAVVSNYDARIEFYPISILGIIRGYKHINSNFDKFSFFDCDKVRCKGDIKRDYTKLRLALGGFGVVALGEVLMSNNAYSGQDSDPVAEFRFAALADPQQDSMYQSRYLLALKHKKGIMGFLSEYTKFSGSGQTHNMDIFIYTHKKERTVYTFGAGQFMSSHWARGFIAVFQMKTSFLNSKSLF
jgi:hypothetical protein